MPSGGPYLQSLLQARQVDWGKSWQWDCRFPDAPVPFNTWFPATEAERQVSNMQVYEFNGFGDAFDIPIASKTREFNVSFIDDHDGSLLKWLDDWMEFYTLSRGTTGTARLSEIVRRADLVQLNTIGTVVRSWSMIVFPIGELTFRGNSESGFARYLLSFRVAGLINPEGTP